MADLLSDNQDVMNSLLRALCDPWSITPPAPLESLVSWQRRAVLAAAAPHITAAAATAHLAEQDTIHADLAQLLRILGLGDHARPQSPHEVFRECLTAVKRLLERLEFAERTGEQIAAAATAAERQRIISLASQLRAAIPADHPEGAQASFADYLRVTNTP